MLPGGPETTFIPPDDHNVKHIYPGWHVRNNYSSGAAMLEWQRHAARQAAVSGPDSMEAQREVRKQSGERFRDSHWSRAVCG